MKKPYKILVIVIAAVFVLSVTKDFLIKTAVEAGASQVLGAPVHIHVISFGIFTHSLRIKGLRVENPAGFPAGTLIDIAEAGVDYDLSAILKGNLHLPLLILNLREMTIIKDQEGRLNVDALKVAQKKPATEGPAKDKKPAQTMPMQIDTAVLNLGKVIVKDYTKDPASIQVFDIGVRNKTYHNIKSAQQFAVLVMVESMNPTALKGAAIYGAAGVLGVAFLPAGVAGILLSKDSVVQDFNTDYDRVYKTMLAIVYKNGQVEFEHKESGNIKAKINGANVVVALITRKGNKIQVKISARKMFLPKPEIANGLMYQLSQSIK